MDLSEVISFLGSGDKLIPAVDAERFVPDQSGLYSIFIDDAMSLPSPFGDYLSQRESRIIYLGRASHSLQRRLVDQDLRHKGPSTFFRGIGAVLGYRPPAGSLKGRRNQNNYRFSPQDTLLIIDWINNHLSVHWVTLPPEEAKSIEVCAIAALRPLFNSRGNPDALRELAQLREQCRAIARGDPRFLQ